MFWVLLTRSMIVVLVAWRANPAGRSTSYIAIWLPHLILGASPGALMAVNPWLGLYSARGEWLWTYGFLVISQLLFVVDPPGRRLGIDALLRKRHTAVALLT